MQIYRARADDAAAGQRDDGFFQAAQQRPQDADRAAHFADEVVVADFLDFFGLHLDGAAIDADLRAERGKNLAHEFDVAEVGRAADDAGFGGQEGGGHDGEHGIFRPADGDFTVQGHAAFDQETVHGK